MLNFLEDDVVSSLKPTTSLEDLVELLLLLCGRAQHEIQDGELKATAERLRETLGKTPSDFLPETTQMSYEQLNELLLLVGENRVSSAFYQFFVLGEFSPSQANGRMGQVSLEDLKEAAIRFRGLAMLGFGNFRYPYNQLREAGDIRSILSFEDLGEWVRETDEQIQKFKRRPPALGPIVEGGTRIPRDQTHYIGYLMDVDLQNDRALVEAIDAKVQGRSKKELKDRLDKEGRDSVIEKVDKLWPPNDEIVDSYGDQVDELRSEGDRLDKDLRQTRFQGDENTDRYLTWDYMDVYVATSMRNRWEFRDTDAVICELFSHDSLNDLKLRWFNPTQCYEGSTIDKGLLEALMLKRAKCTVYMAQENDTLGKDSELAATLAQGKPVIAYVPTYDGEEELREFADKIESRSLDYFRRRIHSLMSEGFFLDDADGVIEKLGEISDTEWEDEQDVQETAHKMQRSIVEIQDKRPFQVVGDQESYRDEFLSRFDDAGLFMAAVEAVSFDKRARLISTQHPLALQVHLDSGVANGVLVARTIPNMARILRGLLANSLSFRIRSLEPDGERLGTVLEESTSNSKFRVVTSNELLGNSFWNFYLAGR